MKSKCAQFLKRVSWALPFIIVDVAIATYGFKSFSFPLQPILLENGWQGSLLAINIAMAVFAVNFSFFSYQSSPYKVLLDGISFRHLLSSAATLLFALLPLVTFAFYPAWVQTVTVLSVPLVAYASVLLGQLARDEVTPIKMLTIKTCDSRILKFTDELIALIKTAKQDPPELELKKKIPPPMHEMGWKPIWELPNDDPFGFLRILASAAIQQGDVPTLEQTMSRFLAASVTVTGHLESRRKEGIPYSEVIDYVASNLMWIEKSTCGRKDTRNLRGQISQQGSTLLSKK